MNDLADVIERFLPSCQLDHQLPSYKLQALNAILRCRTAYMGGHLEACQDCGVVRLAYNSCRNRHCPRCGAIDKERWVLAREADLLEVKYFHVVFTIPDKLHLLFINNQRQLYNLLFTTSWQVLSSFGKDKKWIGGQMGATAILHTGGQRLNYHPHIHMIVPAGALMTNGKWKHSKSSGKYLFNTGQLANVFRARLVSQIRELLATQQIEGSLPDGLFNKEWIVYAKQPFNGAGQVIRYLGRYTHRTAISNERIEQVSDTHVTFSWKDYAQGYTRKTTTMKGSQFLDLFCQHILPCGFTRIRHYGFLSSASKVKSLALIRKSLGTPKTAKPTQDWQQIVLIRMGINPGVCKCCGGTMAIVEIIPDQFHTRTRAPPVEENVNI